MLSAQNTESGELLQAQGHIWNHVYKFVSSISLKCAVELSIPDIIHHHGKPMNLAELIKELRINQAKAPCVYRLMRILIHSGFFKVEECSTGEEGYLLTPACKLLLKDEPMSVYPYIHFVLDPMRTNVWHQLSDWFQNDEPTLFKKSWDLGAQNPDFNTAVNEGMASDSRLVSRVLNEDFKHVFEGISSLVDVGGGTGTMAKAIAQAFPQLKCSVLDLPHVVEGLDGYQNLEFIGGDMFQSIPPADAVLLKWILHDWDDEECVKILKKCKEAIPSKVNGGKVMIIDMVLDEQEKGDPTATETHLFLDMVMMVSLKGKERTVQEWPQLIFKAGFTDYKIYPILGLRSLIELFY